MADMVCGRGARNLAAGDLAVVRACDDGEVGPEHEREEARTIEELHRGDEVCEVFDAARACVGDAGREFSIELVVLEAVPELIVPAVLALEDVDLGPNVV